MPTKYLVTQHLGTITWAKEAGLKAQRIKLRNFDPECVEPGDVVMGTLPVNLAARVNERGGHYWHLCIDLPPEMRGKPLNARELTALRPRLEEFQVSAQGARFSDDPEITEAPPGVAQVQLCIASGETLPNILVMKALPDWKILVVFSTHTMREAHEQRLGHFVDARRGQSIVFVDVPDGLDYEALKRVARAQVAEMDAAWRLDFNLTGGTKLMSMAFAEAFRSRARLLYCDTSAQRIQVLGNSAQPALPMRPDLLNLQQYLWAQGLQPQSQEVGGPNNWDSVVRAQDLTVNLTLGHEALAKVQTTAVKAFIRTDAPVPHCLEIKDLGKPPNLLSTLHQLGAKAADHKAEGKKAKVFYRYAKLTGLAREGIPAFVLESFAKARLIKDLVWSSAEDGQPEVSFTFAGRASAAYMGGAYLEHYLGLCIHHLHLPQDAYGMNVHVQPKVARGERSRPTLHEMDAALVWRNVLWAFECKAGFQLLQGKDQDVVNRLNTLRSLAGGALGRGWLVCLRDLGGPEASVFDRLNLTGLTVVHGAQQLLGLPARLADALGFEGEPWQPAGLLWPEFQGPPGLTEGIA